VMEIRKRRGTEETNKLGGKKRKLLRENDPGSDLAAKQIKLERGSLKAVSDACVCLVCLECWRDWEACGGFGV